MRIIVCGGRDYQPVAGTMPALTARLHRTTAAAWPTVPPPTIITGGARGGDAVGKRIAEEAGWPHEEFLADWARYGKSAGPIRNRAMLNSGADLVIAFPGGRGTANMVAIARQAGVTVEEWR